MQTLDKLGLNKYMVPGTSFAGRPSTFKSAIEQDNEFEWHPFSQPTVIAKKTLWTTLGGSVVFWDKTQGTKVLTYDPATGTVTITGGLVANTVNTGTYSNIILAGTNSVTGTMMNGIYGTALYQGGTLANAVIGTPQVSGGTVNPLSYSINGTVGATGTAIYVKTVNFAGSTTTLGTIISMNGLIVTIN